MARLRYPLRAAFFEKFAKTHAGAVALLRLQRIRQAEDLAVLPDGQLRLTFEELVPGSSRDLETYEGLATLCVACPPALVPLYIGVEMPVEVDNALIAAVTAAEDRSSTDGSTTAVNTAAGLHAPAVCDSPSLALST